jgi:hypothetical protein
MTSDSSPPNQPPAPVRARRWSPAQRTRHSPYRRIIRLLGIPVLAVAAVILYRGLRAHLVLPECDSEIARQTLSQVLKQLKLEPVHYAPIRTVSSTNDQVVCNATMPLPDGGNVVVDYTFYWQGDKADMRYTVHRETAKHSSLDPPRAASYDFATR